LVQFRHDGVVGIDAGVELLVKILPLLLAEAELKIASQQPTVAMCEKPKFYRLINWQPFHAANYEKWLKTSGLIDRIKLLEEILTGHILGFCRAVGFQIPDKSLTIRLLTPHQEFGFKKFSTQNAERHYF
jgi:hypothetical protein